MESGLLERLEKMALSDILSIIEILVTIIVGFFIAHWASVRDSQHRAIKDFYISLLQEIQKDIHDAFDELISGKAPARNFVSWYNSHSFRIEDWDNGLRNVFIIRSKLLSKTLDDAYSEITNLEDFNNHLEDRGNNMHWENIGNLAAVKGWQKILDTEIDRYIYLVNKASVHGYFYNEHSMFKSDISYYLNKGKNKKLACFKSLGYRLWANKIRILVIVSIVLLVIILSKGIFSDLFKQSNSIIDSQEINLHVQESRQDSIHKIYNIKVHNR